MGPIGLMGPMGPMERSPKKGMEQLLGGAAIGSLTTLDQTYGRE